MSLFVYHTKPSCNLFLAYYNGEESNHPSIMFNNQSSSNIMTSKKKKQIIELVNKTIILGGFLMAGMLL